MIRYKYFGDLLKATEGVNFQSSKYGPLNMFIPFKLLKEILSDRLYQEIPETLLKEYDPEDHVDSEKEDEKNKNS